MYRYVFRFLDFQIIESKNCISVTFSVVISFANLNFKKYYFVSDVKLRKIYKRLKFSYYKMLKC